MSYDNTIDFKDHIVQYPNRFKQTTIAPGIVELVPTWIETPEQIIQSGTPVDSELFKKLKQNVSIYQQTFTTTNNQTVINLDRDFLVGQNRVSLSIGGVRQYVGQDYTETDTHTLTMVSPLKGGLKSEIIMFTASQVIAEDFFEEATAAIAATVRAQNAADYAQEVAESVVIIPKTAVANYATMLSTYPNPQRGWQVSTLDNNRIYRFDGTQWIFTGQYSIAEIIDLKTNPNFTADQTTETAQLGLELLDSTGWTVPSGWSGTFDAGFKKTPGTTNVLSKTLPTTGTKLYQVAFRIESPTPAGVPNASTDFTVKIGNSDPFVTYQGGGNFNYAFGIRSVGDGPLEFVPGPTFDGTIKNISMKEIIGQVEPSMTFDDQLDNHLLELRTTKFGYKNVFLGKNSGMRNTTGQSNVGIGEDSLNDNTSGYWNVAVGSKSLSRNTVGSRNVALGYLSLNENISGDRNIAIGTYTLQRNTTGRQNIALGADALWVNTMGSRNIVLGMGAMGENTVGNQNIAIGYVPLEHNISGQDNIALGSEALRNSQLAGNNIAIGRESLKNANTPNGSVNIAIGFAAQSRLTTGYSNTAMGNNALSPNQTGYENAVFGHYAAASGTLGNISRNAIFGAWAGNLLTSGANNNVLLGNSAGRSLTTGNGNILIGYNVQAPSAISNNALNIGNSLYGDLIDGHLSIGSPIDSTIENFAGSTNVQIGKMNRMGVLNTIYGTDADGQRLGVFGFTNMNNTNLGASTRKVVAYIEALSVTANGNANKDSGAMLKFLTKADAGGVQERMRIAANGNVGIGITTPTARLHLESGTNALAPLKFKAGSLLTTPEDGAIEFDGSNLFYTANGVRKRLAIV